MRIVDVNPFFYPHLGGIEHRMHDTSRLLAERGHDVTVLTGRLPGTLPEEERDGYRIVRLPSGFINIYNPPFISSKDVLKTLVSLDADVVNYNYRWAPSYNRDLAAYGGKKVFTYHNVWGEGTGLQGKMSEINDNRFRKTLDTFDHIICVSDHVKDDLELRGVDPSVMTTVPSCLTRFPDLRSEEGDFILSLGRLVKTKGLDSLLEAMRHVDRKLIICGKGPEERHLRRLISKFDLGGRVEMRGWVSEAEKAELMGTCMFFVMPSLFESFGLAAVELMSYGRPVICTDVNGLPHTVGDGGLTVRPGDAEGLADAMNRLSGDRDERLALGRNARRQAERYDWSDNIEKIEDVYLRVIGG